MKVLLIDDKANNGWKQLIEKLFPILGMKIEVAIDYDAALINILNKYDLIFLDVRLNTEDQENFKVKEFSGFKILKKIKSDFLNVNFATPIFLLTATNKIWNIDAFKNYGVDAYYIKEHPDNVFDKEVSQQNYKNFRVEFNLLLEIRTKRDEIWSISKEIIDVVKSHKYFKNGTENINIRQRIIDKIKLGYYYRFINPSSFEKDILKADNEAIAFLIYFSILEELSKAYSEKKTWNLNGDFSGNWKFRNGEYFIQKDKNEIIINPYWEEGRYVEKKFESFNFNYTTGQINLSEQIYALIYHYKIEKKYLKKFRDLNEFRNKLSYTHSSIHSIFNKPLIDSELKADFSTNIKNILLLILEILKQS